MAKSKRNINGLRLQTIVEVVDQDLKVENALQYGRRLNNIIDRIESDLFPEKLKLHVVVQKGAIVTIIEFQYEV